MIKEIILKTRQLIYDLNDNFMFIGMPLEIGWRLLHRLKFIFGKKILDLKGQLKCNIDNINPDSIYWVNPQRIRYYLNSRFKKWKDYDKIKKGKWDRSKKLIEDLDVYKAVIQRFNEGKNWEDTKFYQKILKDVSKGIIKWDCKNKEEWDKILNEFESLYYEIKSSSSESKKKLFNSKELFVKLNLPKALHNIIINISRDGELLLIKGKFMLSLAKLLDIPEVPIIIKTRHKKWINFKKDLSYLSRQGPLYQQSTHPDLQEFPFVYGDNRFNMIKENISITKGNVLDIGANLGYFCRKFEEMGFDCYAVEANSYYIHFLKKLKKAENKKFKIIKGTIFNYKKNQEITFDVVLALFIFHHFLKRRNTYFNLVKLLNRIKVKELFFGAYNPSSFRNPKVYKSYTPDQFVNFILENSCLNKAKFIGKTKKGRCLYKLTSESSSY